MFLLALACGAPIELETPCVPDVEAAFAAIDPVADAASIADGAVFAGEEAVRYSLSVDNQYGVDNHFQGVARVGDWLFVSGGDAQRDRADVFFGALGGDMAGGVPLNEGSEWHAGGLDAHDGVLAVPTENLRADGPERTSAIRLFDVRDPHEAVPLEVLVTEGTSHAAGLSDGWIANWDDRVVTLYRRGEAAPSVAIDAGEVVIAVDEAGTAGVHGQSLNLVEQCDGALYAVMADNTSDLPTDGGTDFADLYLLEPEAPAMTKVGSRALECPPDQGCNFRAAGGVWVDAEARLWLFSVPYYRDHEAGVTPVGVFGPG